MYNICCFESDAIAVRNVVCLITCRCFFFSLSLFCLSVRLSCENQIQSKAQSTWLTKWHNALCFHNNNNKCRRKKMLQFIINKLICYFSARARFCFALGRMCRTSKGVQSVICVTNKETNNKLKRMQSIRISVNMIF